MNNSKVLSHEFFEIIIAEDIVFLRILKDPSQIRGIRTSASRSERKSNNMSEG